MDYLTKKAKACLFALFLIVLCIVLYLVGWSYKNKLGNWIGLLFFVGLICAVCAGLILIIVNDENYNKQTIQLESSE